MRTTSKAAPAPVVRRPQLARRVLRGSVVVPVLLLLCSCSIPKGEDGPDLWAELDSRPRVEQVAKDQKTLLAQVRQAITRITGPRNWTSPGKELVSGCSDYRFLAYSEQGRAETVGSGTWVGTAFPDRNWDTTLAAVRPLLEKNGYSKIDIVRDLTDDRDLMAFGPHEAVLHLELNGMVRLSVLSGCHLISDVDTVLGRTAPPTIDSH